MDVLLGYDNKMNSKDALDQGYSKEEIEEAVSSGLMEKEDIEDIKEQDDSSQDSKDTEDNEEEEIEVEEEEEKEELKKEQDVKEEKEEKEEPEYRKGSKKDPEAKKIREKIFKQEDLSEDELKYVNNFFSRHERGALHAAKIERVKRQLSEKQNKYYFDENRKLKEQLEALKFQQLQILENQSEVDPDELMTRAQYEQYEAKKKAKELLSVKEPDTQNNFLYDELVAFQQQQELIDPEFNKKVILFEEVAKNSPVLKEALHAGAALLAKKYPNSDEYLKSLIENEIKKHPNYNQLIGQAEVEKAKKVEKIIKNSQQKQSSAKVSGGSSPKGNIDYDSMTLEDIRDMSPDEVGKIPQKVYERLMKEGF